MPAGVASVKGVVFRTAVERMLKLREGGGPAAAALDARLSPAAARALEAPISDGGWYPVAVHAELLRLLLEIEGAGDREYLVEGGRQAARALEASGLYAQLRLAARERAPERVGPILVSLVGSIYDFGEWRCAATAAAVAIEMRGASRLPEEMRCRAEGFLEVAVGRLLDRPVRVRSERPDADTLLFHVLPR